jgi:hypothetical protein
MSIYAGTKNGQDYGFYLNPDGLLSVIELTNEAHKHLIDGQRAGKQLKWDSNETPYLADIPEPTEKEKAVVHIEKLKTELTARDYRLLKALKLGKDLDELYPGETDWYKAAIAEINELETDYNL